DSTPPTDPTVSSPSHTPNVASSDTTVEVTFTGASDSPSGVDGFSYEWNTSPSTTPDLSKDAEQDATGTTSPVLADGSHYFHLRTRDNAGNWTSTVHLGPFVIDTVAEMRPPPIQFPPPPPPTQSPTIQPAAPSSGVAGATTGKKKRCKKIRNKRKRSKCLAKRCKKIGNERKRSKCLAKRRRSARKSADQPSTVLEAIASVGDPGASGASLESVR
ncbi:MAG: hypothetical protein ACRDL6_02545, partial [Solirubrobacterales bacterium]